MAQVNQAGIDLIRRYEGYRMIAYPDPGTGAAPWTIGYGHTGPDVHENMTITQERADALLAADVEKFSLGVKEIINGAPATTDNQLSAMVSLAYNIGLGNFAKSHVKLYHIAGNSQLAANSFGLWNRAGSHVMPGLVERRAAEADLYRRPDDAS